MSTSGGGCAVAADLCAAAGLEVPPLTDEERAQLDAILPPFAATQNPIDLTAQVLVETDLLVRSLRVLLASERLDAVLVVLTAVAEPQASRVAEDVAATLADAKKPVVVAWTIARRLAAGGMATLEAAGAPLVPAIERAVAALAAVAPRV